MYVFEVKREDVKDNLERCAFDLMKKSGELCVALHEYCLFEKKREEKNCEMDRKTYEELKTLKEKLAKEIADVDLVLGIIEDMTMLKSDVEAARVKQGNVVIRWVDDSKDNMEKSEK